MLNTFITGLPYMVRSKSYVGKEYLNIRKDVNLFMKELVS